MPRRRFSIDQVIDHANKVFDGWFGTKMMDLYLEFVDPVSDNWYAHVQLWIETMVEEGFLPEPKEPDFEY
jgi:hypothetical protein